MLINIQDVYGLISLIIWSVTLIVSIKYVSFIMNANNHGEGGIMALVALLQTTKLSRHKQWLIVTLGLFGVSLFFGDSIITPAISVLSAVEGIRLADPNLKDFIIPIALTVLTLLFIFQSKGSNAIGRLFGPVMLLWFITSAFGGALQIFLNPSSLITLLPTTAIDFLASHPLQGFFALGAVILALTGVEALYADMGHFGKPPIKKAWFFVVFPALTLNYIGQAALIATNPEAIKSSYFLLFPEALQLPIVLLATIATFIASQAVISGAFSLARQTVQLGLAPRILVKHTSREEIGQVYLPTLNWLICFAVILLVILFGSSQHLAAAYGMAVSGTLAIDTLLFAIVLYLVWKKPLWQVAPFVMIFFAIDLLFVSSSLSKIFHGGWVPLLIACLSFILLSTWTKARHIISEERHSMEGTLQEFVDKLHQEKISVARLPGSAVYLGHHAGMAPLALHATVEQLHELHEKVVIITIETANVPHVPEDKRVIFDELGYKNDGISHAMLRFGFKDIPNVPHTLEIARSKYKEIDFDPHQASYFVSLSKPVITPNHRMAKWRKLIYILLARNETSPTDYFKLPIDRTIDMSSYIKL